ncbi:DNA-directed RNA polymerases I and III subunit RPAC1, partial [Bienertia sinuspersici]
MAIEKNLIAKSRSVVQDKVLAQRFGLIPLKVDLRIFSYKSAKKCNLNFLKIQDPKYPDITITRMGPGKKSNSLVVRACTLCMECIPEEGWDDYVALRCRKDHFI